MNSAAIYGGIVFDLLASVHEEDGVGAVEEEEEGWGRRSGQRVDEGTQVHVCKMKIHETEKHFKSKREDKVEKEEITGIKRGSWEERRKVERDKARREERVTERERKQGEEGRRAQASFSLRGWRTRTAVPPATMCLIARYCRDAEPSSSSSFTAPPSVFTFRCFPSSPSLSSFDPF